MTRTMTKMETRTRRGQEQAGGHLKFCLLIRFSSSFVCMEIPFFHPSFSRRLGLRGGSAGGGGGGVSFPETRLKL